jgi:hypothetical protein
MGNLWVVVAFQHQDTEDGASIPGNAKAACRF